MLKPNQVLPMLVGLMKAQDIDLLNDDSVLRLVSSGTTKEAIRQIAALVKRIFDGYEYDRSPEFADQLAGKSSQFQAMKSRLLTPENKKNARDRLAVAVVSILDSDEAYRLLALDRHKFLDELRILAGSLS